MRPVVLAPEVNIGEMIMIDIPALAWADVMRNERKVMVAKKRKANPMILVGDGST